MESDTFTHDPEYHDIVSNKETLKKVTEKFLHNIIDELTLGIIFDTHRKYKTKAFDLDGDGSPTNDEELQPNQDIFGQNNMKKTQECECPNCDRAVAATRFAPHLEACMGMGRSRSRNASRRIANNNSNNNKERDNTPYTGLPSDDEDDADWSSGDKRRKKKHRNGNKKGKGTPKKATSETESTESVNVDIEGDEDGDISLKDFLQDNSNHSSPVESSNNSTGSKKKDKSKNKKNSKKDRTSPSTSLD